MPKLPSGGQKRRLPDNPSAEMLKRMRTEEAPATNGTFKPAEKSRAPVVRSEEEEEEEEYRRSNDASFAPGGDADYFQEEDGEGRMFGSGLTDEQKTILGIFESAEAGKEEGVQDVGERCSSCFTQFDTWIADPAAHSLNQVDDLNIAGIRRVLLRFERAIDKNQSQRSKYPDDPTKYGRHFLSCWVV